LSASSTQKNSSKRTGDAVRSSSRLPNRLTLRRRLPLTFQQQKDHIAQTLTLILTQMPKRHSRSIKPQLSERDSTEKKRKEKASN
jgi:hypothetical protein